MTDPATTAPSLPRDVGVVNIGLPLFADAIAAQGAPVVAVDWRGPAAGGRGAEPPLRAARCAD